MAKSKVTPVVSRSFEHHTGDSTIWLVSTPILMEDTWGGQGPPTPLPLLPTTREDLRLDGYLESTLMPQKHYTFTNIHVFSGIRTKFLRHSSQRQVKKMNINDSKEQYSKFLCGCSFKR
ncbi:hypothetical protein TNCV_4421721 [Trichonephila clavipes]|nr:hypothetical protein TNCV_4421721 [Trichonephila clavipes]